LLALLFCQRSCRSPKTISQSALVREDLLRIHQRASCSLSPNQGSGYRYQSPRKLRSTAIFIQQLITVKGELALDPTAEEANSKCRNHMSFTWQVKMVGNWNRP
jgi:hypothetical protein